MDPKSKLIVPIITQAVTFAFGVATLFGYTTDPETVRAFTDSVTNLGAQAVGLFLMGSVVTNSAQSIWRKWTGKAPK